MNSRMISAAILVGLAVVLLTAPDAAAVLINQYDFDDGTANDSAGTRDLTAIGGTPDFAGGSYHSDGSTANYLEWTGGAGQSDFTISVWVYTDTADQGDYKGIFSNNDSPSDDNSFQFDSNSGVYRLVAKDGGPTTFGSPTANRWENLILQKFGGGNARMYFNGAFVQNTGYNPGGLQEYRIGINRNSDNSFTGLIDNVQIWNDSAQSAATIYAAGPGLNAVIPEPLTMLAVGLSVAGLGGYVRKRRRA